MRRDIYVYLSGPMTARDGYTIEENCAAGVKVFLSLLQQGIPCHCPHLNGFPPSAWTALPHAEWVTLDEVVIDRCTHMLMLPRWETSSGALREHLYADDVRRLPIFYSVEALLQHLASVTEAA